jgi:hypothetical protein
MVFGAFIHNTGDNDSKLVGKIVRWEKDHDSFIEKFKAGSHFKVTDLAENKYTLIACSKNGVAFKRNFKCTVKFLKDHIDSKILSVL